MQRVINLSSILSLKNMTVFLVIVKINTVSVHVISYANPNI